MTSVVDENFSEETSKEAFFYLYPLILMDLTRKVSPQSMNTFNHMRAFPPAQFRRVVRPNFDTLYSSAWLNLFDEPIIMSVPDTNGRYYLLPIYDMFGEIIATPGKRTTGTSANNFAIIHQGYVGNIPPNISVIYCTTAYAWIIGRIQTNGVSDFPNVHHIQNGITLTPLSTWLSSTNDSFEHKNDVPPAPATALLPPPVQISQMSSEEYYTYGLQLLHSFSPHVTDWSIIMRLQSLFSISISCSCKDCVSPLLLAQSTSSSASSDDNKDTYSNLPASVKNSLEIAKNGGEKQMEEKFKNIAKECNGWMIMIEGIGERGGVDVH
jgi:hypothetical protein